MREPTIIKSDSEQNNWTLGKLFSEKVEEEVVGVMGKVGTIGLYIESNLLSLQSK